MALGVASCQKEDQNVTHFTAKMEQACPQDKTVHDTASNLLTWASGDQVKIFASSGAMLWNTVAPAVPHTDDPTWADFYAITVLGPGPYRALYPASIASNYNSVILLTLPAEQASVAGELTGFPMFSYSETTELQFKNLCGVLKFHLEQEDVEISRIELTADNGSLSGEFQLDGTNDAPTLTTYANGTASSAVALTCSTPQGIGGSGHDFFIYLPVSPAAGYDLTLKMYQPDGSCCTKSASSIVVERNTIYNVTIGGSYDFVQPEGRLPGLFSVSADHQVYFSIGNLQWTSTGTHAVNGSGTDEGTWRFATHQYDYVGNGNANASSTCTSWIDLFGWGTSGYHDSSDDYNVNYYPYSTSTRGVDRRYNKFGYGPSYNMTDTNITGTSANYDWGVYNAISNGGNVPGQWRTLTIAEWNYLLNTRTNAISKKASGRIDLGDGTYANGCILLPDRWILPSGCSFTAGFSSINNEYDYSLNTYTLDQWSLMEAAGAIFLTAGGDRTDTNVDDVGNAGWYWSTTCNYISDALSIVFSASMLQEGTVWRYYGISVRLVQDKN